MKQAAVALLYDDLVNIGLNIGRLNNVLSENNPSGTKYNKWAKDW